MEFFRCVLGKVSCSFIRNSDKNSGICLEIFRNDSKAIWFLWKHNWSIAPSLKIREIRWLQIFSRGVQNFELLIGKQLPLTIIYRTLLYKMTWHVNPLSILQRLSDVCLQKTGKKCWQVIFSQIPLKYIWPCCWAQIFFIGNKKVRLVFKGAFFVFLKKC